MSDYQKFQEEIVLLIKEMTTQIHKDYKKFTNDPNFNDPKIKEWIKVNDNLLEVYILELKRIDYQKNKKSWEWVKRKGGK